MIVEEESVLRGGLTVSGVLRLPANSIGDAEHSTGSPVTCEKLEHQHHQGISQAHGTAAADERRVIHRAHAAGTIEEFKAGPVVAAIGDSTVSVDLRKNGTTVLSAPISIDNGDAAFAKLAATISAATYAAGDVFEVVIDATAGTGTLPQGVWADAVFREAAD